MGWWRWQGRQGEAVREEKMSRTGPLIALTGAGRARWTPRDYAHLAEEGFARNAVAYRCVRMIAEAAASTPLMVMVGGVRTTDHPLARLLSKPNPEQSGGELMEALYGALQTAGNAYVEASGDADGDGVPDELWALRPDRVKVVPGRAGWPEAYEYAVGGQAVRIGRHGDGWSPVMHLTYANYREANAAFWRGTVIPLVRKAAGAMTGWLGGRFADCRIEPDLDAVPALQVERDALWARLNAASFLTDEERRRMAGVGA